LKSFKENIHSIDEFSFENAALNLFRYQARHNAVYAEYIDALGIKKQEVDHLFKIPFLPIALFKHRKIKTGHWPEAGVFESSGTTGMQVSRHYVEDFAFYHQISTKIFKWFYGDPADYIILALLPSYLEKKNSSLIRMVDHLIKLTESDDSGFYLDNVEDLMQRILKLRLESTKKIMLFGVTYALLDLADYFQEDLSGVTIMETGGMKGRREELIREEVHARLKRSFNVSTIHSEYGMTELFSQAYSSGDGLFRSPPWLKILTREINDPLTMDLGLSHGVINVIDLGNVHSCAFIATEDLGSVKNDGSFEILGRMDNSDTRGCNLLLN